MRAWMTGLLVAALFGIEVFGGEETPRTPPVPSRSAVPLVTTAPSPECRSGAPLCRDAHVRLEKCQQASAGNPEACATERSEADAACKTATSACHTDGSRAPPAR